VEEHNGAGEEDEERSVDLARTGPWIGKIEQANDKVERNDGVSKPVKLLVLCISGRIALGPRAGLVTLLQM